MVGRQSSGSRYGSGGLPDELTQLTKGVSVPALNMDPVWSLKPWPAVVRLGGREFEIPAMAAADWLGYLMQPVPDVDGLILDFFDEAEGLLYAGKVQVEDLYDLVLDLISMVCGRPWWVALRQIGVARSSWHVLGPKLLERVDLERISIAAFLDVLMTVTLESMDPKDVAMFVLKLEAVPAELAQGQPAPIESMEMDRGAFLSMQ